MRSCTTETQRLADDWLALALVPGLSVRTAHRLADALGGPGGVLGLSDKHLESQGVSAESRAAWPQARAAAAAEREAVERAGGRVVAWSDDGYPERLRAIADPPLVLAVRGTLEAGAAPAVSVVGARRASAYGRRVAEQIAAGLAQAGVTVVSGLAAGIDAAAHRGTLAAGGHTVAVLATGIDGVYPRWHADLSDAIARQGALVTEFPCGAPPLKHHFPQRNRIVSGLALGTVVVEAARRSGSLITARYALEQGREVFAVPGPLGVPLHDGPHALVREGATLVRDADDVLEAIAPALRTRLAAAKAAAARAALSPPEQRVLDALGVDGAHVDTVVRRADLAPGAALETLLALELRGLVAQEPGMRFRQRAAA